MARSSGTASEEVEEPPGHGVSALEDARRAATERRWLDAFQTLNRIDSRMPLSAEDLELLAVSAFLCGHGEDSRQARLRAYQIHVNGGDFRRAARCAFSIGFDRIDTAEIAQASGCLPASLSNCSAWMAQALALLEGEEDSVEHGLLLVPRAYELLAIESDPVGSAAIAQQAVEIGRRFSDPDLLALATAFQGRALVRSQRTEEGMPLLEESVSLVVGGDVSAPIAGIVLATAVETASETFDSPRFEAWVQALTGWCELQSGMVRFRSRSLAHQATLSRLRGRWTEALEHARQATDSMLADADPNAAASALYEEGEVFRLRGDFAAAETAYAHASQKGHDPQPGLALMRLMEGDTDTAVGSITRALAEANDPLERARLLPAQVEILIEADDLDAASDAAAELGEISGRHDSGHLDATAHQAMGRVLLAQDDPVGALKRLRQAWRVWRLLGLPYHEASSRILIARACRMLGDEETALLEIEAADEIFARLGAKADLVKIENTMKGGPPLTHGLTGRELEVLRLLATGLTNKAIAAELVVAVRTVDSHVSSLYTKLGVSNRSSATAYAHRHHLV